MKRRLHLIAAVLFLLLLADQWLVWGGLGRAPAVGPAVLAAADREVSLASVHVLIGEWLVRSAGLDETAIDVAQARFAQVLPGVLANPAAALDVATARMPGSVRFGYIGAPVMLVLTALLWWRRPRSVHLVRTRR
ncbi:hypothetical protein [Chiayiivirga flava]|uniref:Uncharacterized protein n=1 Tax=Chiayiivirga flava TaxID=659595 RepID=A0A7W8D6F1_9GAMM|nr:hypothetical protein [Chiayiivirga flava]MBB5207138.1 hypothetical protein [Chiayiivirga flava]